MGTGLLGSSGSELGGLELGAGDPLAPLAASAITTVGAGGFARSQAPLAASAASQVGVSDLALAAPLYVQASASSGAGASASGSSTFGTLSASATSGASVQDTAVGLPQTLSATSVVQAGGLASGVVRLAGAPGPGRVLLQGLSEVPLSMAEVQDGLVLMANGVDPVLRWDALSGIVEPAGVQPPATAPLLAALGPGTITGAYRARVRYVDRLGNVSDPSDPSAELIVAAAGGFTYLNVPFPLEPKVVRLQVLRNTAGQYTTYYVDIDTTDLSATQLTSTRTDDQLKTQEAVPFVSADGSNVAFRYGVPLAWKRVVAVNSSRAFFAGETEYRRGSVQVIYGSASVQGAGTFWPASLAGRDLHVSGSGAVSRIKAVDPVLQVLTLADPYRGPTDRFAAYAIRATGNEARLLYWSEPGKPESVPASNALEVPENSDRITGLLNQGSFLYVLLERHIWKMTFRNDPAVDGHLFQTAHRGCVNHRLFVQADDVAYLMDERGVYSFDGGDQATSVSDPVRGIFLGGDPTLPAINWSADRELWHAAHEPERQTVKFFVALAGHRLPRHALCYNYRDQRWWIEEYPRGAGCSARVPLARARTLAGTEGRRVWLLGEGNTDGATGRTRGTISAAAGLTVTDPAGAFSAGAHQGQPLTIAAGPGTGQVRRVAAVRSATEITIDRPWTVRPRPGDAYQLGGFAWRWQSGWQGVFVQQQGSDRSLELAFRPTSTAAAIAITLAYDHNDTPRSFARTGTEDGITTEAARPEAIVDLARPDGWVRLAMEGHGDAWGRTDRYVSVVLAGVQPDEALRVHEIVLRGLEGGQHGGG